MRGYLRAPLELDDGSELWFTDARRFGHGVVLERRRARRRTSPRGSGIEPLSGELTAEALGAISPPGGRRRSSRSCSTSGASPGSGTSTPTRRFTAPSCTRSRRRARCGPSTARRCVEGIVEALEAGLDNGGSSIDDYRDARGERGSMQDEFLVHTREGEDCLRCGAEIRRIVVGGRSTYFCPDCQVAAAPAPAQRKAAAGDERAAGAARGLSDRALERSRGRDRLHGRDRRRTGRGAGWTCAAAGRARARRT